MVKHAVAAGIMAIVVLLAVGLLGLEYLGGAQHKAATTTSVPGVKYSQSYCLDASNNATAMEIAIDNGVTCFRADIALNPTEPAFTSNVTKGGGQYLGILDYVTMNAQTSQNGCASNCNWTLSDWNATVANAVAEYPWITQWEIYNEPLVGIFVSGYENGNATHYFNMIKSAYTIIKGKNPNATVVCFGGAQMFPGSVVQYEYAFYSQVWADGAAQYCDAISLHAYTLPYSNLNQTLPGGVTVVQSLGHALGLYENLTGKPIWITETGFTSNDWATGISTSQQTQASFLQQDFAFFARYQFVKKIYWFHLVGENGRGADYGLLNFTTLQPKQAWHSFLYFLHNSTAQG